MVAGQEPAVVCNNDPTVGPPLHHLFGQNQVLSEERDSYQSFFQSSRGFVDICHRVATCLAAFEAAVASRGLNDPAADIEGGTESIISDVDARLQAKHSRRVAKLIL